MNVLCRLPDARDAEHVDELLTRPGLRIAQIVSLGQASPPGFWYDQDEGEWILLLAGAAQLRFADEAEARVLRPGDPASPSPGRVDRPRRADRVARGVLRLACPETKSGAPGASDFLTRSCGGVALTNRAR